jgi:hypothetical protein
MEGRDMEIQFRRPAVSGLETKEKRIESSVAPEMDGGGPLFTIFNTLLDYPEALEAVRAELERKRQKLGS